MTWVRMNAMELYESEQKAGITPSPAAVTEVEYDATRFSYHPQSSLSAVFFI